MDMDIVEVLNILYLRIMSLDFNHRCVAVLVCNTGIESEFPDMSDGLIWMFSSDAYITIKGMFSNGKYSFRALKNKNVDLDKKIEDAENRIENIIPNFTNIRNRTFAHFVDKRNPKVAQAMFVYFSKIFDVLISLHETCCSTLGVSEKDLNVYDNRTFIKIDECFSTVSDMMTRGFISLYRDNLYSRLGVVPNNNFPLSKRFLYMNQYIPLYYRVYLGISDFIDRLRFGKNKIRRVKQEDEDGK